ncbi:response regulator [Caldinitratiruptor microaerophilus]|uniref:Stage 0 sporulation protein A homolog n=1 Tax=Caldinitratiruptor microaerophilus TaxID=671077 RepID=A0AA35CJG2_9FIRM|nr:response regulator [Caldinitratiruptor microaerophilus]BDG60332.1 response regulator [Caldinitratiruptor microaerophilus]
MATILVADDSIFMRKKISSLLARNGYQPEEASDGEEACAKYNRLRPALVIMNVVMPGMDGLTATRVIRSSDPNARIIVMSALKGEHVLRDAIRAGAMAFLSKPVEPSLLLQLVRYLSITGPGCEPADNGQQAVERRDTSTGSPTRC